LIDITPITLDTYTKMFKQQGPTHSIEFNSKRRLTNIFLCRPAYFEINLASHYSYGSLEADKNKSIRLFILAYLKEKIKKNIFSFIVYYQQCQLHNQH